MLSRVLLWDALFGIQVSKKWGGCQRRDLESMSYRRKGGQAGGVVVAIQWVNLNRSSSRENGIHEKVSFWKQSRVGWVTGGGRKKQNYTRDIVNKCKTWTSLFTTQLIIRWSLEKLLIFWLVPSFQGSGLCPLCRSTSWGWLAYVVMSVLYLQGSRVPAGGPLRGGTDTGKHIAMEPRQGPGNCSLITGLFLHIYIEDNGYSIQRVLYSY